MVRSLFHRGPDGSGVYEDGPVMLGHARLSIIDLSPTGHQPMFSSDGETVIVFNGEIYNFLELRAELEAAGAKFRGRSDTEVILHAWRAWGSETWVRLNGMFAIAIWDRPRQALHLVRDRFGIKPLYMVRSDSFVAFASEIKAFVAGGIDTGSGVSGQGLAEYLTFGNTLGRTTLYPRIEKVEPGCEVSVIGSSITQRAYWRLSDLPLEDTNSEAATERVKSLLLASVRRQLVSDVPVGVFLSGGIDSSAIVAAAASLSSGRLSSYTARFDFDQESADVVSARRVAAYFGTEHHELDVGGYDVLNVLERLIESHDGPFGDAANVPLFLLTQALRGNPKVVLQGDGGDELFGGYTRYELLSNIRVLAPLARLAAPVARFIPNATLRARVSRLASALGTRDPALRSALLLTEDKPDTPSLSLMSRAIREQLANCDPALRYREVNRWFGSHDPVQRMLLTDCAVLLPDIFLEKVDRSTMAQSTEIRVPLLDHDLADFVLSLPSSIKMPHGKCKGLFKEAVRSLVPEFVLNRPKAGFGVPYGMWLRGPLAGTMRELLTTNPRIFDPVACGRVVDAHVAGTRDHSFLLWKLLSLSLWLVSSGRTEVAS